MLLPSFVHSVYAVNSVDVVYCVNIVHMLNGTIRYLMLVVYGTIRFIYCGTIIGIGAVWYHDNNKSTRTEKRRKRLRNSP